MNLGAAGRPANKSGLVPAGLFPVGGAHLWRAVGEGQAHCQPPLVNQARFNAHGQEIKFRMNRRADHHRSSLELEAARQNARPEVELLVNVGDVCKPGFSAVGPPQTKPDLAQVQSVRVLAQPREKLVLSFGASLISNRPPVGVVIIQPKRPACEGVRTRSCVPTPLRQSTERHRFFVLAWERLKPRYIAGEGELAV